MTLQVINRGARVGDTAAESVYDAFGKVNSNTAEIESEIVGHGSSGTGQYRSILHKTDVNSLDATARACVVSGGGDLGSSTRAIEPGTNGRNEIGAHASYVPGTAHYAVIAGGYDNRNDQLAGTVGGGGHNLLSYLGSHGTIGGGSQHAVLGDSDYGTIGGGTWNVIGATAGGDANTIAGGYSNDITRGNDSTVGGGRDNQVTSTGAGGGHTVAGGNANAIGGSGSYSNIAGGQNNSITSTGNGAAIVGGATNASAGAYSVVGGQNNSAGAGATSATLFGASSVASDPYQLVFGLDVSPPAGAEGALCHGANGAAFGADGSAQALNLVMTAQTTDAATAVHMAVRGTTAPTIPLNSAWVGTALVIGKRVGQISVAAYWFRFCVSRHTSGNIVVEYEPAGAAKYLDGASLPDEPGIGTTNVPRIRTGVSTFQLTVNGAAGVTINWVANIQMATVVA